MKLRPTVLSDLPRDRLERMLEESAREIARLKRVVLRQAREATTPGRPPGVTLH